MKRSSSMTAIFALGAGVDWVDALIGAPSYTTALTA